MKKTIPYDVIAIWGLIIYALASLITNHTVSYMLAPVFSVAFYWLASRRIGRASRIGGILFAFCFVLLIAFTFVPIYSNGGIILRGQYYISQLRVNYLAMPVLVALLLLGRKLRASKLFDILVYIISELEILYCSSIFYTEHIFAYDIHYDAYFYPVYKILSGQTQFVDFTNIYGSYEYIIALILKMVGHDDIRSFSIVICVLVFISLSALFVSMCIICENKIKAFLSELSMQYFMIILLIKQQGNAYYLQFVPHRIIFPSLIILLITLYYVKKIEFAKYCISVLLPLSIFWNAETGIVITVAVICVLTCESICLKSKKPMLLAIKISALSVGGYFIILYFITWVRTRQIINPQKLIWSMGRFANTSNDSFDILGFHNISFTCLMLIFAMPIILVIIRDLFVMNQELKDKNILVCFFLFTLTYGMFAYAYFKRNHPYNITPLLFLLVILVVSWHEMIIDDAGRGMPRFIQNVIIAAVLMLLGCSTISTIKEIKDTCYVGAAEVYEQETYGYLKSVCNIEDTMLLMINSEYMYTLAGVTDPFEIQPVVDFLDADVVKETIEKVADSGNDFVIDQYGLSLLDYYDSDNKKLFDNLVGRLYYPPIISENGNLYYYRRI